MYWLYWAYEELLSLSSKFIILNITDWLKDDAKQIECMSLPCFTLKTSLRKAIILETRMLKVRTLSCIRCYHITLPGITWAASISKSCFWMSKDNGRNMQRKTKSDFSKNDLCHCLQVIAKTWEENVKAPNWLNLIHQVARKITGRK